MALLFLLKKSVENDLVLTPHQMCNFPNLFCSLTLTPIFRL